jgi:hypothetical protein
MSELDASNELAPVFGVRPLPAEVQEMFEPMLGCFAPFSKGDRVDEVVTASHRKDGLLRVVERFEMVLDAFLRGKTVDVVGKVANVGHRTQNLLDVHANYVAGILIVGTAASRQLRRFGDKPTQRRQFSGEPFRGAFWRCVSVLTAGGVALDDVLAARLFDGMVVAAEDRESQISELDSPLRVGVLSRVDGFRSRIATSLSECLQYVTELELAVTLLQAALTPTMHMPYTIDRLGYLGGSPHRESRNPLRKFVAELVTHGMAPDALMSNEDDTIRYARHLLEEIAVRSRHSKSDAHEIYARFDDVFRMLMSRARPSTWRVLEETYRTVRRFRETPALSPRKRPRATGSSTKDGESSGR